MKMKIIYSGNIPTNNPDWSDEYLWLDNLPDDKLLLTRICAKLNKDIENHQGPYYRFVEDNYKLYVWEP